jgi:hypothetical protein
VPLHLGSLHAYEQALVALLAFGPFVVLAFVVRHVRRRDLAEEARDRELAEAAGPRAAASAGQAGPEASQVTPTSPSRRSP